jgi:hypothetical protein
MFVGGRRQDLLVKDCISWGVDTQVIAQQCRLKNVRQPNQWEVKESITRLLKNKRQCG